MLGSGLMQEAEQWLSEGQGQYSSPWTQWVTVLKMQGFGAAAVFLQGEARLLGHVNITHCLSLNTR